MAEAQARQAPQAQTPPLTEPGVTSPDYRLRALLVIAVAGVLYGLVARFALQAFPFSGDEYSYLLQAEGFARGVLKGQAPSYADWAAVDHVVIDRFVRSKYPPGTSALLSLGVRAGLPWLVTPLEAVLTLLVTWLTARRVLGDRRGFLTVAFLAAMPLFAYQAATYFSHTATLLWMSLATLAVARWGERQRSGWLTLFGASVGMLFLTRPLDAVLVGLSLVALRSWRGLLVAGASALPFVGAALWYNALQFGSPFTDGYHAYLPAFTKVYGPEGAVSNLNPLYAISPEQIWNHLAVVETFFAIWTVPGAILLACLGWVALRSPVQVQVEGQVQDQIDDRRLLALRRFFGAVTAAFLGTLLITFIEVDDGPRCRYLSILLIPLAFFAAAGWDGAAAFVRERLSRSMSWALGLAIWIAPLFLIATYLEHRVPEIVVRSGLARELARQGVDAGVVIVRAEWPTRYARNGMFFDRAPILLSVGASTSVADVAARFPGEAIYEAHEPHGDNPWKHAWSIQRVK